MPLTICRRQFISLYVLPFELNETLHWIHTISIRPSYAFMRVACMLYGHPFDTFFPSSLLSKQRQRRCPWQLCNDRSKCAETKQNTKKKKKKMETVMKTTMTTIGWNECGDATGRNVFDAADIYLYSSDCVLGRARARPPVQIADALVIFGIGRNRLTQYTRNWCRANGPNAISSKQSQFNATPHTNCNP